MIMKAIAAMTRDIQVRRLPVLNRNKRLVGFVSSGDIATRHDGGGTQEALRGISQPGGTHSLAT